MLPLLAPRVLWDTPTYARRRGCVECFMLRTSLTDAQRSELQTLRRTDLPAVARDRLEMVLMSAAGWSPPKIAEHLGRHPHTVRAARPGLAKLGIYLYYLPPYSPELNRIEPVFKQVKHHEMPTRSFTTRADLRKA